MQHSFLYLKMGKIHFHFQKLPIQTAHHTFLESRHPEVTKNPYYLLSHNGSQKKVSAHGLIPVCRGVSSPHFKINPLIFCCPLFSENYLNPQVRINKIVNKHTADYHPSPSQLILRIHPPEYFLNFFLILYIPPWLQRTFEFIVLRLLATTFVNQKTESVHFYLCLQAKLSCKILSLPLRQKKVPILPKQRFLKIYFSPSRKGGRGLWSWKNYQSYTYKNIGH